jgi:hypothetical protein
MMFAQRHERAEARPTVDHIIFGVHFEPQAIGPRHQRLVEMLQLEAEACGNFHV